MVCRSAVFLPFLLLSLVVLPCFAAAEDEVVQRGAYLVRAGGCIGCHTDVAGNGPELAGGRALATPFGTFYSPNITPDLESGIGRWTDADFLGALKQGRRPDGSHYFPVFPFTSYTKMSDEDALAIKRYLFSRAPVVRANRPHDVPPPFSWRFLQAGWKWLFFDAGELEPDPGRSAEYNRGHYLVSALGHCGECHTPRNWFGARNEDMALAGNPDGPDGERVPNITPDKATGIGDWSEADITQLLKTGMKPDFDNVQGSMQEAISFGLRYLTDADRAAIAVYLLALPPIENQVPRSR